MECLELSLIDQERHQSGKGTGEFDSPWQKIESNPANPYQKGQSNKSPSLQIKRYLDAKPTTPSEEEIKWRRKMLSGAWTETKKDT